LAQNPSQLGDLRRRLQENKANSVLFDTKRFAAALEEAYRQMWACFSAQQTATSFDVALDHSA
jgi:predicted O-linked N-acetylglucosamine transferase (SPINDLY family)